MVIKSWNIEAICGYKPKTTFYEDFSIADAYGEEAVRDTYERAFEAWHEDVVFVTELVMALNWKIWEHYDSKNEKLAKVYDELWRKADGWCMDNLKGDDLSYFFRTTD